MVEDKNILARYRSLEKKLKDNFSKLGVNLYVELINDLTAITYDDNKDVTLVLAQLNDFEIMLDEKLEELSVGI